MTKPLKIGVVGGAFNPIHYGHLRIAEELREVYALDQVRLIPTGVPAHRFPLGVSGQHRVQMAQLAAENIPHFVVDSREIARDGYSYTIDTLTALQDEYSHAQLVWLVGSDAFAGLADWHRWLALLDIAHLAIVARPGASMASWQSQWPKAVAAEYRQRLVVQDTRPYQAYPGKISLLPTVALGISATLLRNKVAQQQSLRFLTPDPVIDYIDQKGLYQ